MKVACLALIHIKEFNFTFSNKTEGVEPTCWKTWLFLSFNITYTEANQIIFKNKWVTLGNPAILINWCKWCLISPGLTEEIPNQCQTWYHIELKITQSRNKCLAVSGWPHPNRHATSADVRTLRRTKLSLIDNLLRRSHHTNKETVDGICWCQTLSSWYLTTGSPESVWKRYALLTEQSWVGSRYHRQLSEALSCKTMLWNKTEHSLTLSSSQANKRRRHTHAPPPPPTLAYSSPKLFSLIF